MRNRSDFLLPHYHRMSPERKLHEYQRTAQRPTPNTCPPTHTTVRRRKGVLKGEAPLSPRI